MEKNIFEGAKFGDKFLTRDGRIAIFACGPWGTEQQTVHIIVETKDNRYVSLRYDYGGTIRDGGSNKLDIVSKYQEPIDEFKLDEESHNYYEQHYDYANYALVVESYKAGYRSAFNNKARRNKQ